MKKGFFWIGILSILVTLTTAFTVGKSPPTEREHPDRIPIAEQSIIQPQQETPPPPSYVESQTLQPIQPIQSAQIDVSLTEAEVTPPPLEVQPLPTVTSEPKFRIPVLNYHSVAIDPGNIVVISPQKLEEQMAYLAKEGYTTLRMQQFIEIWEGTRTAEPKSVLLTFDDGYTDNFETAMPILKKYGFHATLFMSPGWINQEGYVTWEQVKDMQNNGWDIYPHGMTHPNLSKLSAEQQTSEIVQSRKLIEEKLGTTADVFCYPYGLYNKDTLKIMKQHHYKLAFTITQGRVDSNQNPYMLKRLFINGEEDIHMFIKKLTQWK